MSLPRGRGGGVYPATSTRLPLMIGHLTDCLGTTNMPILRILTNVSVPAEDRADLFDRASSTVAELLGKPESYVMVILEDGRDLFFAGTSDPIAYVELKSIGLPELKTAHYSRALCDLLAETLDIPAERIYIEFSVSPRHLFGWNGGTF